jgi:hypothetical protein
VNEHDESVANAPMQIHGGRLHGRRPVGIKFIGLLPGLTVVWQLPPLVQLRGVAGTYLGTPCSNSSPFGRNGRAPTHGGPR